MASKAVMDAVTARLATAWTRTPIMQPNVAGSVPADGKAFLYVDYPVVAETQISFGDPVKIVSPEEGGIRFILSCEIGKGTKPYDDWIEGLRDAFRGKDFDGVTTFEATPAVINDGNDDGAYFEMSFSVEYRFDKFA